MLLFVSIEVFININEAHCPLRAIFDIIDFINIKNLKNIMFLINIYIYINKKYFIDI